MSGCIIGGLADGCHRLNQKWSDSILTPGLLGGGHLPPKDSWITQNRFVSSIKLIPVRPQVSPCSEPEESAEPVGPCVGCKLLFGLL